jgi:hypothetical protein
MQVVGGLANFRFVGKTEVILTPDKSRNRTMEIWFDFKFPVTAFIKHFEEKLAEQPRSIWTFLH